MKIHVTQFQWSGYRINSLPPDHVFDIWPEPGWPQGRKGQLVADYWTKARSSGLEGLLFIDPDIVADPDHLAQVQEAVDQDNQAVYTGWYKLWPASTRRPDWIWSNRPGQVGYPLATQDATQPIAYFSTGFVWVPARLMELATPHLPQIDFAHFDPYLSEVALLHRIPIVGLPRVVLTHVHF